MSLLAMSFFSQRFTGLFTGKYHLRHHRNLHCVAPGSFLSAEELHMPLSGESEWAITWVLTQFWEPYLFGIFSALGIEFFTRKADLREDSAIAMLWALGMALGIIFIFLTPGYAPNLMSYLFGNILTVSLTDLIFLTLLTLVIATFFILFYRMILFISFDEEYALTNNTPVRLFNMILICLVCFNNCIEYQGSRNYIGDVIAHHPASHLESFYPAFSQNDFLLHVLWVCRIAGRTDLLLRL